MASLKDDSSPSKTEGDNLRRKTSFFKEKKHVWDFPQIKHPPNGGSWMQLAPLEDFLGSSSACTTCLLGCQPPTSHGMILQVVGNATMILDEHWESSFDPLEVL